VLLSNLVDVEEVLAQTRRRCSDCDFQMSPKTILPQLFIQVQQKNVTSILIRVGEDIDPYTTGLGFDLRWRRP
jgi:hypothetical protein